MRVDEVRRQGELKETTSPPIRSAVDMVEKGDALLIFRSLSSYGGLIRDIRPVSRLWLAFEAVLPAGRPWAG